MSHSRPGLLLLAFVFALLQAIAPLSHAHIYSDTAESGIHVAGIHSVASSHEVSLTNQETPSVGTQDGNLRDSDDAHQICGAPTSIVHAQDSASGRCPFVADPTVLAPSKDSFELPYSHAPPLI